MNGVYIIPQTGVKYDLHYYNNVAGSKKVHPAAKHLDLYNYLIIIVYK